MCLGGPNSTQQMGSYGRVSKPDAAGYIMPVQAVSAEEQARRLAEARARDQAAPATDQMENSSPGRGGTGYLSANPRDAFGASAYRMKNPDAGARESAEFYAISQRNQQAQRDLRFVNDNPAYLAKNEAKAPNTATAGRTAPATGGGGPSTLITGGTAAAGSLTAKKPTPTAGRATLLGM